MTVTPGCPDPMMTFSSSAARLIMPEIMAEIRKAGFTEPTPIQAQAWPAAMMGRDVIGVAKTGSGKTLAFLMPAFKMIKERGGGYNSGCSTLVLAPTRELAVQIQVECNKFGRACGINSTCVYGGAPKHAQLADIRRGVHVVVATPGRLNDFLEGGQIRLSNVNYLVFDEADRMLDMGFEPQIRKILGHITSQRQTMFFTATWPREVRQLAMDFLKNPMQMTIGNTDDLTANKDITQKFYFESDMMSKTTALSRIIQEEQGQHGPSCRILIFCGTKRMCDQLANQMNRYIRCSAIHGDKDQRTRDMTLNNFKNGSAPILIATDVAARGLDVKGVVAVINFDFASNTEDYVHRIGRTGRAGEKGTAHTFLGDKDGGQARKLIKIVSDAGQVVPPQLHDIDRKSVV